MYFIVSIGNLQIEILMSLFIWSLPDYAVKEKPSLVEDMEGRPDYIVLKNLDTDSIRVISSVLGQSIALDYFVSQVMFLVLCQACSIDDI